MKINKKNLLSLIGYVFLLNFILIVFVPDHEPLARYVLAGILGVISPPIVEKK